jgi:hypothetical protein
MSEVPEDLLYPDVDDTEWYDIIVNEQLDSVISYDSIVDRFYLYWEGDIQYFESFEAAEDWYKLNSAR